MGRYRTNGGVEVEMSDTAAGALGFEPADAKQDQKDEAPKVAPSKRSRKSEQ